MMVRWHSKHIGTLAHCILGCKPGWCAGTLQCKSRWCTDTLTLMTHMACDLANLKLMISKTTPESFLSLYF